MSYAVVYIARDTQEIESVVARGMEFHTADRLVADLYPRARDGFYFAVRNETEIEE